MTVSRNGSLIATVKAAPAAPVITSVPRVFTDRFDVTMALPGFRPGNPLHDRWKRADRQLDLLCRAVQRGRHLHREGGDVCPPLGLW